MDQFKSFSEYLKAMKHIPANSVRSRQIDRSMRSMHRDTMRDMKRIFSPMPPTPFKPSSHSTMIQLDAPPSASASRTKRAAATATTGGSTASNLNVPVSSVKDSKVQDRMAKLKKWREERAKKRAAEKAKQKPAFKAAVHLDLPTVSLPPLGSRNHKFKPPANIKPIVFQNADKPTAKSAKKETIPRGKGKMAPPASPKTKVVEEKPLPPRRKLNFQADAEKMVLNKKEANKPKTTVKETKTKVVAAPRVTRQTNKLQNPTKPNTQAETKTTKTNEKTAKTVKVQLEVKDTKKGKSQRKTVNKVFSNIEELPEDEVSEIDNALIRNKENVQVDAGINLSQIKNTAEKAPRRSLRTLAESNQQDLVEDVPKVEDIIEDVIKPKKSTRFKTPTKTPVKTPKTPKVMKSRRSAGRTPRRKVELVEDEVEEDKENVDNEDFKTPEDRNSSCSMVYPCVDLDSTFTVDEPSIPITAATAEEDAKCKTPEDRGSVPVYVSPFVTMSRGKRSARSEYKSRSSKGGELVTSPESTGVKAAANYFYNILECEIARIQGLCDKWEEYKNQENLPEEACNMINVPIGQSQLLISKKMKQFRALIDKSLDPTDGLAVKCTDLHGFWDSVLIQVSNLDQRFENLIKLRDNQWLEVLPLPKIAVTQCDVPKRRVMPQRGAKKIIGNSKIRDAIKAARANCKQNHLGLPSVDGGAEFNGGFFSIKSPVKQPPEPRVSPRKTPRRTTSTTSLLKSVLHSESRKSVRGSPGLAMMKATQNARRSDGDFDGVNTPTKSILKVATPRSSVKKAVFFKEAMAEVLVFDNVVDEDKTSLSPPPSENATPLRRSLRLSKSAEHVPTFY